MPVTRRMRKNSRNRRSVRRRSYSRNRKLNRSQKMRGGRRNNKRKRSKRRSYKMRGGGTVQVEQNITNLRYVYGVVDNNTNMFTVTDFGAGGAGGLQVGDKITNIKGHPIVDIPNDPMSDDTGSTNLMYVYKNIPEYDGKYTGNGMVELRIERD